MKNRPNILFIMVDQMAAPLLPMHQSQSPIQVPNLKRLAQSSTIFDAAYCASPLCAPARFCLMSGCLPSRIGAFDNAAYFPSDIPTYAHYLRSQGYHTALSGKMHFIGADQLHGFEQRLTSDIYPADFGWTVNWDEPDKRQSWYHNMSSVIQAGYCVRSNQIDYDEDVFYQAKQYLYDQVRLRKQQSFCLTVSFTHPHDPYTISRPYWDLYEQNTIALPRYVIEQSAQDQQSKRILKAIDLWDNPLSEADILRARHAYFGACSYIDDKIGELLYTLEECGLGSNTVIIFSGDHGDMLGERGLWYKMHWFEMAARVPLMIKLPENNTSRHVTTNVSTMDLMPTIVELAGAHLSPSLNIDGRSLLSLLNRSTTDQPAGEVVGEYMGECSIKPLVMIKRAMWKFIYAEDDVCLLYNLANDADEQHNLAQDSTHHEICSQFKAEVHKRWDLKALQQKVIDNQRRRLLISYAQQQGKICSWDFQPFIAAESQYIRNHMDLDDLEARSRFPPC